VAVRYDDLNLATDTGVRTLYARLRQAAVRVCPDRYDRQPERARFARACQAEAIDAAVAEVHSPRLAALHARGSARG
jgi:UrcA family protein